MTTTLYRYDGEDCYPTVGEFRRVRWCTTHESQRWSAEWCEWIEVVACEQGKYPKPPSCVFVEKWLEV